MDDHFTINVAMCVRSQGERREYEHKFKVTLPAGKTKQEAFDTYHELRGVYPMPEYEVTLTGVVVRYTELRRSPL